MVQRRPMEEISRIPIDEAKRKLERSEAIIVDVREKEAYDEGHVKGAIHLPLHAFPRRYQELPRDKEVITY